MPDEGQGVRSTDRENSNRLALATGARARIAMPHVAPCAVERPSGEAIGAVARAGKMATKPKLPPYPKNHHDRRPSRHDRNPASDGVGPWVG
jgi:hypothetical protein